MRFRVGLVFLALAACAHSGSTAQRAGPGAAAYYPLAVGNRWTYEVNLLGEKSEKSIEILRQEQGYFADNQGGELAADAFGVRDQKRYLLREPIEAGREWTNVVSVSSVEHYRILEANSTCEAPAGKFEDCVRVEGRNRVDGRTTLINDVTFAPRVGIVRIEVVAETNGRRIPQTQLALKSYKVAPTR